MLTFDSSCLYWVLGTWLCPLLIYGLSHLVTLPPPSEQQVRSIASGRRFVRVMLYLTVILLPVSLMIHWVAGTLEWAHDGPRYIAWITIVGVGWSTGKVLQDWYGRGERAFPRIYPASTGGDE